MLVSTPEQELVSHVGLLVRAAILDGAPVKIGGIGSVKTHPRAEGRGYASAGLRRAASALNDDHKVAFSLKLVDGAYVDLLAQGDAQPRARGAGDPSHQSS